MNSINAFFRMVCVTFVLSLGQPVLAETLSGSSQTGRFSVTVKSLSSDLAVGRFEEFEVAIADPSGAAVEGATVVFSGGMPGHGHGFPTAPVVTEIGGGLFRLEGVKFSMRGAWEMTLTITAGGITDTVRLNLEL